MRKSRDEYKTIRITKETHDLLAECGDLNDTFDTVIRKLLEERKEEGRS